MKILSIPEKTRSLKACTPGQREQRLEGLLPEEQIKPQLIVRPSATLD